MIYAERTQVPVEKTKTEIEHTLTKYGADRFAYFTEKGSAMIVFEAHDRRLRFKIPLPPGNTARELKAQRQKWRALLLCIKAKLESVAAKIETFEEAFLAHVVMPDGQTVGDITGPGILQAYKEGHMVPLIPPPSKKTEKDR